MLWTTYLPSSFVHLLFHSRFDTFETKMAIGLLYISWCPLGNIQWLKSGHLLILEFVGETVLYRWQKLIPENAALAQHLITLVNGIYTIVVMNLSCIAFMVCKLSYSHYSSFSVMHFFSSFLGFGTNFVAKLSCTWELFACPLHSWEFVHLECQPWLWLWWNHQLSVGWADELYMKFMSNQKLVPATACRC